jgi:hypothetical protein
VPLSQQAPHPISDSTTESEAVGVFKGTGSRTYLMAGTHRNASTSASTCQSGYRASDAAHNVTTMFHATTEELAAYYGAREWWAIQWHGMAADTCGGVDAYLSHGRNEAPAAGDKIAQVQARMRAYHPSWNVEVPGTGTCSLNATENTQGRLLNGVPAGSVCGTEASSYSGAFLHIEQDPNFRTPGDWIPAVNDTWPVGVPPAPGALAATAGDGQVVLAWTASAGATTYSVYRGTTGGGPYVGVTTGLSSTAYTDAGLANGTAYYYVVTASNGLGESAVSNEASATPRAQQVPAAPASLTATPGKRKVTLSWSASVGATTYTVKRGSTSGGPYAILASNLIGTTYVNSGLKTGVTYYYVVSARNAAGESPNSREVRATAR